MDISAAMIIKRGEEKELERCLKSLKGIVSQIVAVTSPKNEKEDETDRLLSDFGADVFYLEWPGDYSVARNESLKHVTGDYVLVIDTDEYVKRFDFSPNPEVHVYRLLRENEYTDSDMALSNRERLNRIFKNGLFHYEGRVHEQLVPNDRKECITELTDVILGHTGYTDPSSMLEKSRSYREMLLSMLEDSPDDPYVLFQIGRTYYVEKDYENAVIYFEKALNLDPDPDLEYVESLLETYGYALLNHGEAKKAMSLLGVYDEFSRFADFLFLCGLIYMNNALFDEAIAEFEKAAETDRFSVEGVNSYLAFYNCGVIKEVLGDRSAAISYYKKCGDYPPSKDAIKRLG